MGPMPTHEQETRKGEEGATATEYGLLVLFIALAIVAGVTLFGTAVNDMFDGLATWVDTNLNA